MLDGVAIVVGMVVGAGIFKTPSLVAANCSSTEAVLLLWLAGGAISLVGALCYAELTSAYPHPGGDYHYLNRAFGTIPSFLFAWSRMTVIQTGAIAMHAFLIGDYASQVAKLGPYSSSVYAVISIALLTTINIIGMKQGKWTQNLLTGAIVLGLVSVVALGLTASPGRAVLEESNRGTAGGSLGLAMIFVLLTYGGWNEIAYLSSEVRKARKNMVRVLLYGIGAITVIYLTVNYTFLRALGLQATASSEAVAANVMRSIFGEAGVTYITLLVVFTVLSSMNAIIITGSRTNYAFGRDFFLFSFMGRWQSGANTPVNALLFQGIASLVLVFLGTGTRSGFAMMVEYTAPVFWLFFLLVGISLFVLRRKEGAIVRPFRVPLYPLTPLIFCGVCLYMLYSSIMYTGTGGLIGLVVLLAGIPFVLFRKVSDRLDRHGSIS
ncbi:MAG: Serine/threonine exchanger SteT [Syntrophorhabdaceae bacterium PtaU1.Bin034]|nr:MAG: Serine/threonine exchanger SteT [Syntrophorhabdaceae bacterium PtaU1.Bin034]